MNHSNLIVSGNSAKFELKPSADCVGYYEVAPDFNVWLKKKPTWMVRFFTKLFLGFEWEDALKKPAH